MSAPALFCNRSLFIYKHDMFAVKYLENSETYGEENKTALQFSPPPQLTNCWVTFWSFLCKHTCILHVYVWLGGRTWRCLFGDGRWSSAGNFTGIDLTF